jgi:hypothetical protein
MTQRERGWDMRQSANDIWEENISPSGLIFVNTVTDARQPIKPTSFHGGILAVSKRLFLLLKMKDL